MTDSEYEDKLAEDGRQLALNLLKYYKDVKTCAIIAGVATTSLFGLIIKISGNRDEVIERFIKAFRSTIDEEIEGWAEVPTPSGDEEEIEVEVEDDRTIN